MKTNDFFEDKPLPAPSLHDREKCLHCREPLGIHYVFQGKEGKMVAWHYGYHGHFCSEWCGLRWANQMIDNNYIKQIS